jgi:general secretion pathway protein A
MYESFFNFEVLPFECTPNPRFFFASEQHREALAAIEYTIRMRKGVVMVTGAIGSGKTTVGRTMLQRCGDQATIVQLVHGHTRGIELVKHVLRSLNVAFRRSDDHAQMLEALEGRLREQARLGKPVVLFMDEAQTLSDEALEELRLLCNFDSDTQKLMQLVLIGQPELRDRIRAPQMAPLRQRIVLAKQLQPLSLHETAGYVLHRLVAASRDRRALGVSFSAEAIEAMFAHTRGVPRLINVVCDNCLLLAFVAESRKVVPAMVRRVVADMVPDLEQERRPEPVVTVSPQLSLAGSL